MKGPFTVLIFDASGRMCLNGQTDKVEVSRTVVDLPYLNFEDWLHNIVPHRGVEPTMLRLTLKPKKEEGTE